MKTVIIHGQSHKGSTYHVARQLADEVGGETKEFFLPRDFGEFCIGCTKCFMEGEDKCPHYEKLEPITRAIDEADLILLESPVYVYHATGAMKAFLDHYAYRWMIHRPHEAMFKKQGVCVATAAGAGVKSTIMDMKHSLFFWGVARRYGLGFAVAAVSWNQIVPRKKAVIDKKIAKLAAKIKRRNGKIKPNFRTRFLFLGMHLVQRKGFFPRDKQYWDEKGWTENKRPWK
ncbi:flavodoxin family protein [Pseudobutyrivibrio sp.]|jgi:multimeric flavodoxin WrbA|uniref:flavodoxin family protein n=1 Tax=Pseudobutyrivibrio sp. TaxID=2014367 RepID=UPI0025EBE57F|nr:NAD(P)H-dependent oxidoreductase [Pseudobutyrivibrio sp.]